MCGGFRPPAAPAGNWRTAKETLWPSRAGNSALLAFVTLKVGGVSSARVRRRAVKVNKFESTEVAFGGTMRSVRMSGSLA